jgi:hypothetical protein
MQFVRQKREGSGVLIGGRDLLEGLGFWAATSNRMTPIEAMTGPISWHKEDADRWAPHVSSWASVQPTVSGVSGRWAGLASVPGPNRSPRPLFYIFLQK